jgi:hypothetical protein
MMNEHANRQIAPQAIECRHPSVAWREGCDPLEQHSRDGGHGQDGGGESWVQRIHRVPFESRQT